MNPYPLQNLINLEKKILSYIIAQIVVLPMMPMFAHSATIALNLIRQTTVHGSREHMDSHAWQ
jgi:hypothetical protein